MLSLIKASAVIALTTNSLRINTIPKAIVKEQYTYNNPVLEIPKIKLKKEMYPNDKEKNNVDKNIQVIEGSQMPTKHQSNLILASHSGSSDIAYFKHLDQININDTVYIYYKIKKYKYVISDIYDVQKTGNVEIKRDRGKNAITLITCKKNTNLQTVYIGYLVTVEKLK